MLRSLSAITVLASLLAGASLATIGMTTACSSSTSGSSGGGSCDTGGADGGTCEPSTSPNPTPVYVSCVTGSALQSPTISFSQDIAPTFNGSCGLSAACHQPPANVTTANLVLGMPDGGLSATKVLQGIVNKASVENPQMPLVKAGDPANSYLMHKLDGDQCQYASACNPVSQKEMMPMYTECGGQMPLNSGVVDQPTRDKIRRWIAQGAQNN